ncbi:MAG: hypothetical protein QOG54_1883 [Actinomycetota bacterium]|jgi:CSLREA domain-containing protein|nr:hypothetical protein [Actinomycetota bacterium]
MALGFPRRALCLLATVVFASFLAAVAPAHAAATFAVTSTADEVDASPGDGLCAGASGACTLRAAVMEANATLDNDTISLEAPAPATYEFTVAGSGEDGAAIGDLDLKQDVSIVGRGPTQDTIDAAGLDRAIDVLGTGTSAVLKGLTITGGNVTAAGGGVLNAADLTIADSVIKGNFSQSGGGISSSGVLAVDGTSIESNNSSGQAGGISVSAPGTTPTSNTVFSLSDSELRSNIAESVGGGLVVALASPFRYEIVRSSLIGNSANAGGGIWNNATESTSPSLIRDSTIAVNSVSDVNCSPRVKTCTAAAEGGGLVNIGAVVLQNDTIVFNTANKGGGGIANGTSAIAGQTTISNSIIAKNGDGTSPDNCINAPLISLGGNIEDSANDCGIDSDPGNPDADGDRVSTDPQLGVAQADLFGPTTYYAPSATSPAIDNGKPSVCTSEDQLGQPRPVDGNGDTVAGCDVGAIELYERSAQCTGAAICGTGGDDEIQGTEGNDVLVGGPGDDHIVCGGGDDIVYADEGNDSVDCGEGDDVINGGPGDDLMTGGPGADSFFAGDGDDSMYGDFEEPTGPVSIAPFLNARGEGKDKLYGEGGDDFGFGGGAFDRLFGGAGKDRMWGGQGDDDVKGQDGDDKLYGQDGADELDGGKGADQLRAGAGRDVCIVGDQDTITQSCDTKKRAHKRAH